MKGLTIATFISNNEHENPQFYSFIAYLNNFFDTQVITFSDKNIKKIDSKVLITPHMTKYKRIQILLNEAKFDDILCLDNDITPNKTNILTFVSECLKKDYSIAWGKIKVKNPKGFTQNLINIDKNLSHDYIRPLLWNLNIGISLPGQIFMINKKYLKNKLPNIDTVYDDLMIGSTVRENNYPVYFTKKVLGYEKPKKNIFELVKQRIRWAKGLAETIMYNINNKVLPYILLHGFAFNLLWVPIYILLFGLFKLNCILGLVSIIIISQFLAEKNLKNTKWALIYMFVFPLVYFIWGISLVYNLIMIKINNKKRIKKKTWIKNFIFCFKKQANMQKKES